MCPTVYMSSFSPHRLWAIAYVMIMHRLCSRPFMKTLHQLTEVLTQTGAPGTWKMNAQQDDVCLPESHVGDPRHNLWKTVICSMWTAQEGETAEQLGVPQLSWFMGFLVQSL